MRIGIPMEIKSGECRVAITPAVVHALVNASGKHEVIIQQGAGLSSGISDAEFEAAGAQICSVEQVWTEAELILKVKEPLPEEFLYLRPDLILFTYLHLASNYELTKALLQTGTTAIAYETVQMADGNLPLLTPMSEIAGRIATQYGAHCLTAHAGGRGVLLGGVPGVLPANVVVLGCGIAGHNAARIAIGMEAQVTVLDVNTERLRTFEEQTSGRVLTLYSTPMNVAEVVRDADLVIGAVLVAGARAPRLITREMIKQMQPGAVLVDIAIDQGGCIEGIRPTSHADPTYLEDSVLHYAVPNIPAAVPRTSTYALSYATSYYVMKLVESGLDEALAKNTALAAGLNTRNGKLIHPGVCTAFPDLCDVN